MSSTRRFLLIASLAVLHIAFSSSADARTYYVRVGGNNSSSGLSWSAAWATPNYTNGRIVAGDTVLFGAGRWLNSQIAPPAGGTFAKRTVYACSTLTTATQNQSIISGGEQVANWTVYSGSIWRATWAGSNCFDPGDGGKSYTLTQNDQLFEPVTSLAGVTSAGKFFHDYSTNTVYAWTFNNANPNSVEMLCSCKPPVIFTSENQDHLLFFGLDFRMGKQGTIVWRAGADSVAFSHCNLSRTANLEFANAAVIMSSHFVSNYTEGSRNQWGRFNSFTACSVTSASAEQSGVYQHNGSGAILYDQDRAVFDSCVFYQLPGDGVMFKYSYTDPTSMHGEYNVVRYCTFQDIDGFGADIYTGNYRDSIYGNTFVNIEYAGLQIGGGEVNPTDWGHHFIANNTFYRCNIAAQFRDPDDSLKGDFLYNIIYDIEYNPSNENYFITLTRPGFATDDKINVDSNMWYDPSTSFTGRIKSGGVNWSNWRTAGHDQNGLWANPNFSNPTAADFSRPTSTQEMNRAYGGRVWTRYGAWQPPSGPCTAPGTPTLVAPANAASGLSLPLAIDWSDVSGATTYQLQIDDNADFSSPFLTQSTVVSSYSATGLSSGVPLYWRTRALNGCGPGNWSSSRVFSISCSLPGAPSLLSPIAGATNLSQPVTLVWSDVAGALLYEVQVDNNSNFSSANLDQQVIASAYVASGLPVGTLFYWRARANTVCGWGSWSSSRTFATSGNDAVAPLVTDISAKNITANEALITWTTNEPATSQIDYGLSAAYGLTTSVNTAYSAGHAVAITGLSQWTTYHYRVRSRDASGNEAVSADNFLTTTESMLDLDSGIQPTVSSSFSGYLPARLTDDVLNPFGGTSSTWAATESSTQPHWVEVDFGASRVVKRVIVYWAWNATQSRWMTSQQFRLQSWNGSGYTDAVTVSNTPLDSCTFLSLSPVTTTRIRYYQPANMGPPTYPGVVWLCELDVFGLINTAPAVPQLSSPANGMIVNTLLPTLTVGNSLDAEGSQITYLFQVSKNSNFGTIVAQTNSQPPGTMGTTSWVVSSALTPGTTYFWHAAAHDDFLSSNFTTSRSFAVSPGAVAYICGDADGSGMVNISDVVNLIGYIFFGGTAPNPIQSGDVDCSGSLTISDVVYLISYIFSGGQAACAGC